MPIIDISRTLNEQIAVWPGDTPFQLQRNASLNQGDSVNLTTLILSAHTGTHLDAPFHFQDDGATIDELDLTLYWGKAQVVTVHRAAGPLQAEDFAGYNLALASRLLVRSDASELDPGRFPDQYVYPSPEVAQHLGQLGVILYGSDSPSMDAVDSKTLPGHNSLYAAGIAILEGLDLSAVADGLYELVALPLKIAGGDGTPVRAALRTLEP